MGTVAIRDHRPAAGRACRDRGATRCARGAVGEALASPAERRAGAVRVRHAGAVVLRGAPCRARSTRGAALAPTRRCRAPSTALGAIASGAARAVRRTPQGACSCTWTTSRAWSRPLRAWDQCLPTRRCAGTCAPTVSIGRPGAGAVTRPALKPPSVIWPRARSGATSSPMSTRCGMPTSTSVLAGCSTARGVGSARTCSGCSMTIHAFAATRSGI